MSLTNLLKNCDQMMDKMVDKMMDHLQNGSKAIQRNFPILMQQRFRFRTIPNQKINEECLIEQFTF